MSRLCTISKEFLSRRPLGIRTTSPLYLSCVSNPFSQVQVVQATADGNEQAKRHDEGHNQSNCYPKVAAPSAC